MSLMQNLPPASSIDRTDDPATYDARDLIRNGIQAHIVLDGQTYTLRITRTGKLILTK
ncbi:hemin uptake protein HemP [Pseudooceanicola sp. 216_PA32_1]|uniref:Hemin uptake protein HemP n=2 Tax=Pseudooceanicola pacificus TaxID=2676438 RepID=A0A844W7H7_9RHOB|nr:hemin uptake protein HemP [Pseudooceanicola pacificus]